MAKKEVPYLTGYRSPNISDTLSIPLDILILSMLLILFFNSSPLWSRDFPEPIDAFDALSGVDSDSPNLLPASFLQLRYDNFTFHSSVTDDFQIQALGSFTLLQYQGFVGLKLSYGTFLLVGPLAPGDVAASTAKWWMNSVQFQYGLYGAFNVGGVHLLWEYSRLSNHPLRAQRTATETFENPASERLATGIVLPPIKVGSFRGHFYYRTGFVDLFDYWKAKNIPKPRNFWVHRFGMEASYPIHSSLAVFSDGTLDLLALRTGGWDVPWTGQIGFQFSSKERQLKVFLTAVWNNDTEEIVEKPNPIRLLGLGFSLSTKPLY
ncbi:MAG: hypothetical protein N2442_01270 [Spirochaetes bacterium]|nr:hypothetical protein [Spirochaetota bacterium]